MRVLVTGCAGFAGSHICDELLRQNHEVVGVDKLTYATRLEWFAGRHFVHHDLAESFDNEKLGRLQADVYVHNAADSHVSNSLGNPEASIRSNVLGTLNVLEAARHWKPKRFIYVSTDEVFGPSPCEAEAGCRLAPTNVYAATKAAGEYLVHSYRRSFGVPTLVTRTCNMFGPRQHIEKFVPHVIGKILRGETVNVHTTASGSVGRRRWCPVGDQARAIAYLAAHGLPGETYHVSEGRELSNLEMAELIAAVMKRPLSFEKKTSDRPFYDECYRLKEFKMAGLWKTSDSLVELLRDTVKWYQEDTCV